MTESLVLAGQAIVVALIVLVGQIAVARLSGKAQGEVVEVDAQEKATKAWQDYAAEIKNRLDDVEGRLGDAETNARDDRRRIVALERGREADRDLIRRLLSRLRRAMSEITHLGGQPSEGDQEVADLAEARLSID